eukprot:TRINITY_DN27153_c0_g1_i1.p1 TRINITY_DN27153_c0_g1~~TRINITY_DN27153_c0_g1_i1.p1  ORF type:complete len:771 (+),score=289.78 TRINITY_DN27153_c0_g1_i1:67-2379(+)
MVQNKGKKVDKNNPFQKKKQKVGKKKLAPVNATKAEIHAQTIFIKKQTKDTDGGVYINERNLTFKDCLTKLGHYGCGVRKEGLLALHGMVKTTLGGEAEAVPVSAHATLLNAALPLLNDADGEARRAVVALLKITLQLLDQEGTLRTLLPLVVRFLTVALTHLDAPVRRSACSALHHVCMTPCAAAMPEALMLLDCCHGMLAAASRPFDRVQPPVQQAYLSLLRTCLLRADDAKPLTLFAAAAQTKHNPHTAGAVAVDGLEDKLTVVPPTLSTPQGITKYLTDAASDMLFDHWTEAVQDAGRATKVGAWELGILEALNSLLTALAARQASAGARPLPLRMAQLPRVFKDRVGKMVEYFPFTTGSAEALRVNVQLALLLSTFLPHHAAPLRDWTTRVITKAGSMKVARPADIQALAVVLERVGKYAPRGDPSDGGPPRKKGRHAWGEVLALPEVEGKQRKAVGEGGKDVYEDLDPTAFIAAQQRGGDAASDEEEPPADPAGAKRKREDAAAAGDVNESLLSTLFTACGAAGTATSNEVLSAVERRVSYLSAAASPYPSSLMLCVADAARVLFELAGRLGTGEGKKKRGEAATRSVLIPVVDGGVVSTAGDDEDPAYRAVDLLLRLLLRFFNAEGGAGQLRDDMLPALFGMEGVAAGLVEKLAPAHPDLAHTALSLLPHLLPPAEDSDDVAADHLLTAALPTLAAAGAARDVLTSYTIELLGDYDLADSFALLDSIAQDAEAAPIAAAAARRVLDGYAVAGEEEEEAAEEGS